MKRTTRSKVTHTTLRFIIILVAATSATQGQQSLVDSLRERIATAEQDALHAALPATRGKIMRLWMQVGHVQQSMHLYPEAIDAYMKGLALAERNRDFKTQARILWHVGVLHDMMNDNRKARACFERSLALSGQAKDRETASKALNSLGVICRNLGEYDAALRYYEHSLKELRKVPQTTTARTAMANTLRNIGNIHTFRGANKEAITYYRRSLSLWSALGSKQGLAEVLQGIGLYFFDVGSYDSALLYHRRALALNQELGDMDGIGSELSNMGKVFAMTGFPDSAMICFKSAAKCFEAIGARRNLANALNNIGIMHRLAGDNVQAADHLERANGIQLELGDRNGLAESYGNIGGTYMAAGAYEKALNAYLKSLTLLEEVGGANISKALYSVGLVYSLIGNTDKANEYLGRSLALAEQQEDKSQQALALLGLGNASGRNVSAAIACYEKAYRLYTSIGAKSGVAKALTHLGSAYSSMGWHDKAIECLNMSMAMLEEGGEKRTIISTLISIGESLEQQRDLDGARAYLIRALECARQAHAFPEIVKVYLAISKLDELRGDREAALEYLKLYAATRDSLVNQQKIESMHRMTAQFESTKKLQEIALLKKNRELMDANLARQQDALHRASLEAESRRQRLIIAEGEREREILERERAEADLAKQRAEKQTAQANEHTMKQERDAYAIRERWVKNAVVAGICLAAMFAFIGYTQVKQKRRESELRASAAEYQAQAAEYQARATETEMLRMQAENERRLRVLEQDFSRRLIESQEQERKRVAAELHDGIGQELIVIKNRALKACRHDAPPEQLREYATGIVQLVAAALGDVRAISRALSPYQIDAIGLRDTIKGMVRKATEGSSLGVTVDITDIDNVLPKDGEVNLYRLAQEAMNNILKHAHATSASIRIAGEGDVIRVTITDDGKGFDASGISGSSGSAGLGLRNMTERVRILGGSIHIQSSPGSGTVVQAEIPLVRASVYESQA